MSKLSAVVCVLVGILAAAPAAAQPPDRAWVDVNVITAQSNQGEQEYVTGGLSTSGNALAIAQLYEELPRAAGFDIEGGYTFGSNVGFGVRWVRARYDYTVAVGIGVSHPLTGGIAGDGEESDEFRRTESAVDLMATYHVPLTNPNVRLRLFGGPSYFSIEQQMVRNVSFIHTTNLFGTVNLATITAIQDEDVDGTAWGYNVGADVGYFFSRHVGVGAGLRFNHATISDVDIPITGAIAGDREAELDAGHMTFAFGVRFRF